MTNWIDLPDHHVQGAAGRLAVRDTGGSQPPLLLLHGLGRTLLDWALLAPELAQEHRVVAIDLRGHGESDDAPFAWDGFHDDIDCVIKEMELTSPALVGHSLGALLAVMYAKHRDGASSVVCIEGPRPSGPKAFAGIDPAVAAERLAAFRDWQREQAGDALSRPVSHDQSEAMLAAQIQRLAASNVDPELVRAGWYRGLAGDESSGYRYKPTDVPQDLFSRVDDIDLFADFRAVHVPLQVWFADQPLPPMPPIPDLPWMGEMHEASIAGYYRALDDLRTERPDIALELIEGSHMVILERPRDVAERMLPFLAAHVGASVVDAAPSQS